MKSLISLLSATLLCVGSSFAQTNINGQIRNDVTWTKAGSPYICTGKIELAPNTTLTVEPGVKIVLEKDFDVYGSIVFQGNDQNLDSIVIANTAATRVYMTLKSQYFDTLELAHCYFSYVNYATMDRVLNLVAHDNIFDNCQLYCGAIDNGNISIYENEFRGTPGQTGSVRYGSYAIGLQLMNGNTRTNKLEIYNNSFKYIHNKAIHGAIDEYSTVIRDNYFEENNTGIYLDCDNLEIKNNTFIKQHIVAIDLTRVVLNADITSNIINDCNVGIKLHLHNVNEISGKIAHNSIYNNNVGVDFERVYTLPSNFVVENNCIYDNKQYNLKWQSTSNYNIGANWWGATNTADIDAGVFDYQDDFKYGTVNYTPFLTTVDSNCKADPQTNTNVPSSITTHKDISVYPNPFNNTISFDIKGGSVKEVSVYNVVGRKLASVTDAIVSKITISTVNYPSGIYIYKIQHSDNTITTGKLIKQ